MIACARLWNRDFGYQAQPDDIVGKMTIAALDIQLVRKQGCRVFGGDASYCGNDPHGKFQLQYLPVSSVSFTVAHISPSTALASASSAAIDRMVDWVPEVHFYE
jgi:hypothetical protein